MELLHRLVEIEIQVGVLQGGDEGTHLLVGDGDHMTLSIAVVVQPESRPPIPFRGDNLPDLLSRGLYKNEIVEVVTKAILVLHGIIVLVPG